MEPVFAEGLSARRPGCGESRILQREAVVANLHEAYLEVTMLTRLCNIVLRRPYLHE